MKGKILIVGAGGIGEACGLILAHAPSFSGKVCFADRYLSVAQKAEKLLEQSAAQGVSTQALEIDMNEPSVLQDIAAEYDVILDCLPGKYAPVLAKIAKIGKCHYVNLTEYVNETEEVMDIARDAETAFVLQAGLAPGFVNVLAMHLFNQFCTTHQVHEVKDIKMKVGALSRHVEPPHYYAFTWSPIGVATEYIKDAYAVRDAKLITIPSLSERGEYIIDGQLYEDNVTSGGAADLPQALAGRVENLEYKTLRYVGHYEWVKETIANLSDPENVIYNLEKRMLSDIPRVENDKVVIYVSVAGFNAQNELHNISRSYTIYPSIVGGVPLRAIQTTTAGPMCQIALMLLSGKFKGPVLQSMIDTQEFLDGEIVKGIYGEYV